MLQLNVSLKSVSQRGTCVATSLKSKSHRGTCVATSLKCIFFPKTNTFSLVPFPINQNVSYVTLDTFFWEINQGLEKYKTCRHGIKSATLSCSYSNLAKIIDGIINILFLYFLLSFFLIHRSATNLWNILGQCYHEIHYKFLTFHSQVFKILFTVKFGHLYMVSLIFYFFISCYHSLLFFAVRQTYGKYLYHEIHYKFLTLHSHIFKILLSLIFHFFISYHHYLLFFAVRQTYGIYLPNDTMKYIISF